MSKDKPFRIGVFSLADMADKAVQGLVDAGFDPEDISVICSKEAVREQFPDVDTPPPTGEREPGRALTGGAIGAVLGGAAATAIVTTGGAVLFAAGALLTLMGAGAGTFVGAMTARGVEREIADFYDQALEKGKVLVAVHADGRDLSEAERVFSELGAEPIELSEG